MAHDVIVAPAHVHVDQLLRGGHLSGRQGGLHGIRQVAGHDLREGLGKDLQTLRLHRHGGCLLGPARIDRGWREGRGLAAEAL